MRQLHRSAGLVALVCVLLVGGCSKKADAPQGGGPGAMPPPEVGVITVAPETIALTNELPGRLDAWRTAQVRARAAGIVQKRLFVEGSDVKAGQLLYQIDSAPYRATLASAQAALARAEANLSQSRAQVERYKPLIQVNAVSKQDFVNAEAAQKQSEADVASARAVIETAQINLGYTAITAPISGRIGPSLVTEGALVGQGEATPMALIQQIDPLYVNFTQSTSELLQLRKQLASGQLKSIDNGQSAEIQVVLEDGSIYPKAGKLIMAGTSVDPSSGQITLRAELPNPERALLPGMYTRVRIEQAQNTHALLVPQQAVQRNPLGAAVLVVDDQGKVTNTSIKTGRAVGTRWIVEEGLKGGEKVIVEGFQKMMVPGAPVKPVPWQMKSAGDVSSVQSTPAASTSSASTASGTETGDAKAGDQPAKK